LSECDTFFSRADGVALKRGPQSEGPFRPDPVAAQLKATQRWVEGQGLRQRGRPRPSRRVVVEVQVGQRAVHAERQGCEWQLVFECGPGGSESSTR